jgi:hypothetical protein
VAHVILIGVDLEPNLSVTGSLATILWLIAIRRECVETATWEFLKIGLVAIPSPLQAVCFFCGVSYLFTTPKVRCANSEDVSGSESDFCVSDDSAPRAVAVGGHHYDC